jgi:hypothetical protein
MPVLTILASLGPISLGKIMLGEVLTKIGQAQQCVEVLWRFDASSGTKPHGARFVHCPVHGDRYAFPRSRLCVKMRCTLQE